GPPDREGLGGVPRKRHSLLVVREDSSCPAPFERTPAFRAARVAWVVRPTVSRGAVTRWIDGVFAGARRGGSGPSRRKAPLPGRGLRAPRAKTETEPTLVAGTRRPARASTRPT